MSAAVMGSSMCERATSSQGVGWFIVKDQFNSKALTPVMERLQRWQDGAALPLDQRVHVVADLVGQDLAGNATLLANGAQRLDDGIQAVLLTLTVARTQITPITDLEPLAADLSTD